MKIPSFLQKNAIKLLSVIELILGLGLLTEKIFYIYSFKKKINSLPEGLKEIICFSSMEYGDILLWLVLLLTGLSYWINKKIYWIFTKVFLVLILLKVCLPYCFMSYDRISILVPPLFLLLLFVFIEVKLFKIKQIETVFIDYKTKISGIVVNIICSVLYCYLELMFDIY